MAHTARPDPLTVDDLPPGSRLLTADEVSERLRTTKRYVWSLGRRGILARVVLPGGRLVRFLEADVEALILERRSVEPVRLHRATREPRTTRPASAQLSMRF
jgi:predicted DNA-binding transcriptional regulator AlpA